MRINWRILFGIAVSVLALAIILKDVSLARLGAALATANYWWAIPSAALAAVSIWLRAVRWRALLDDRIPLARSFWIANAGNLLNNVLPLRLGELGRAYLAGRNSAVSSMQALSTVFIERLLDVLTVFGMLMIVFPLVPHEGLLVRAGMISAAVAFTGVAGLFVAAAVRERALVAARLLTGWLPLSAQEMLLMRADDFLRGVNAAGGRRLILGIFWSIVGWIGSGLGCYALLLGFVPDAPWYVGMFTTSALALGLTLPSSPSGAGLFEAAAVAALALFKVPADVALAYAIVLHLISFVIVAVFGTIGLDREGESFKHLAASAQAMLTSMKSSPQDK